MTLTPGHWLIAAFVLGTLESLFPGAAFLWFALAAAAVAVLSYLLPIDWQIQIVLFGVLALVAIAAWRQWRGGRDAAPATVNRRGRQHEGQVGEVVEPIRNGTGKARIGDGVWTVRGPDLPTGSAVRVVAIENTVLVVVAADDLAGQRELPT